ncbi:PDZ domain-containing protein [Kordiimonas sp. SCSIO 12610]|uniref:PDZ domain-containing protein n=1 Tax=Kordiimonas sp. SCSIO 12610 TaxID=2829597 RepID=UPI00210978D0|nr:PDZ domain-containing protein [Kordiimonas sp. SCSIO 12610]UTW54385.1 PDZ domain-containing protein [Kordiimonas sp. SCSIO 12610]
MKHRLFLVIFLCFGLCPQTGFAQSNNNAQARAFYFVAEEAYENKKYSDAFDALKRAEKLRGETDARFLGLEIKILFAQKKDQRVIRLIDRFYAHDAPADLARDIAKIQLQTEKRIRSQQQAKARRIAAEKKRAEERRRQEIERKRREAERERFRLEKKKREEAEKFQKARESDHRAARIARDNQSNSLGITISDDGGILTIIQASEDGAGYLNGLQVGSNILKVNGIEITSTKQFIRLYDQKKKIRLRVKQLNAKRSKLVTKTIKIDMEKAKAIFAARKGKLGIAFGQAQTYPILAMTVTPQSPAARGGIQAGDFILAVGDTKITSTEEFLRQITLIETGQVVVFTIDRLGKTILLPIKF